MAKWGFGEASGARGVRVQIDIFGMLGARATMADGLSGLVRVLKLTSAISSAKDQTSESAAWLRDNPNPIGFEGWRGPRICVWMGLCRQ